MRMFGTVRAGGGARPRGRVALMREAERIAVGRGIGRLMVDVLTGNAVAEEFYARCGFRSYAIELGKAIGQSAK